MNDRLEIATLIAAGMSSQYGLPDRASCDLLLQAADALISAELASRKPEQKPDEWTVRAVDYDKLLDAANALRSACKDRLPPGQYDKLSEECRAVDEAKKAP
jgi:hypothetical protein